MHDSSLLVLLLLYIATKHATTSQARFTLMLPQRSGSHKRWTISRQVVSPHSITHYHTSHVRYLHRLTHDQPPIFNANLLSSASHRCLQLRHAATRRPVVALLASTLAASIEVLRTVHAAAGTPLCGVGIDWAFLASTVTCRVLGTELACRALRTALVGCALVLHVQARAALQMGIGLLCSGAACQGCDGNVAFVGGAGRQGEGGDVSTFKCTGGNTQWMRRASEGHRSQVSIRKSRKSKRPI